MAGVRRCVMCMCLGLVAVTWSRPLEFSARKHACGVCREVRSGLGCELFSACHIVNASSTSSGCDAFCPSEAPAAPSALSAGALDVRVTKAFGTKGYDQVRISVISPNATPPVDGFFDYSAGFVHKWTNNYLHSAITAAVPGGRAEFNIGTDISVRLPQQGAGVAGVLIADPCMGRGSITGWLACEYSRTFETDTRTVEILNTFVPDPSTDFWGILGDNFYDRTGEITADVFSRISLAAKAKVFVTVAGNHDFWVWGVPGVSFFTDQCGNGFMQFYAQDTKAAENVTQKNTAAPFDFSVNPFRITLVGCNLPAISNFFWYNQIGNVGMVGQSGAYPIDQARPFMAEACAWLARQPSISVVVLLGHWDVAGDGATEEMAMPRWSTEMAAIPGCAEFHRRRMLKYVMGHTHCNDPHPYGDAGAAFRIGGFGMDGCGDYGVPILDTTENRVRFWYFDAKTGAKYSAAIGCVRERGWRNCTHLAELWLDDSIVQAEELVV